MEEIKKVMDALQLIKDKGLISTTQAEKYFVKFMESNELKRQEEINRLNTGKGVLTQSNN